MSRIIRSIDGVFGIKTKICLKDYLSDIVGAFATAACVFLYVRYCGKNYETTFGVVVYLLIFLDICGSMWCKKIDYEWNDFTQFDCKLMEAFRILSLFIIPCLSFNQFLRTDLHVSVLGLIFVVPGLYVFPLTRYLWGGNKLYSVLLKISLLLNLIVSMRTTFFGVCASVAVICSWAVRRKNSCLFRTISRCMAAYLIYITLCIVAIPYSERVRADPCARTPEQCDMLKLYWDYTHKKTNPD